MLCLFASVMSNCLWPYGLYAPLLLCPGDSQGKNTEVSSHALLQRIFPNQELNPCLLHWKWIIYHWTTSEALKNYTPNSQLFEKCESEKLVLSKKNKIKFSLETQFSSVAQSSLTLCDPMDCSTPVFPVHHTPRACSNSCPSSQWCHSTISSSIIPFFSCVQSFPTKGYFLISQFFISGGRSIGISASASVLPVNIQDWFPLG